MVPIDPADLTEAHARDGAIRQRPEDSK